MAEWFYIQVHEPRDKVERLKIRPLNELKPITSASPLARDAARCG